MLRILAVFLVIYGHFVSVGMYAPVIPTIISDPNLPLLPVNFLAGLDNFLLKRLGTLGGVCGVTIFFLVTGYLMPMMMDKYTRLQFLINRFFRIFPALIVAVVIIGFIVYYTQGISFSIKSYISSITLTYDLIHTLPVTPVLWTLIIEVLFYIICAITGKFSVKKLILLQSIGITTGIIIILAKQNNLSGIIYYMRFFFMIFVGSSIYLSEKSNKIFDKILIILHSFLISFLVFTLSSSYLNSIGIYDNFGIKLYSRFNTHLITLLIFISFKFIFRQIEYTKIKHYKILSNLADLVYPLYLLHTSIGLITICLLRNLFSKYFAHIPTTTILVITLLIVLGFSIILHNFIEIPGIQLGKYFTRRNENKSHIETATS